MTVDDIVSLVSNHLPQLGGLLVFVATGAFWTGVFANPEPARTFEATAGEETPGHGVRRA